MLSLYVVSNPSICAFSLKFLHFVFDLGSLLLLLLILVHEVLVLSGQLLCRSHRDIINQGGSDRDTVGVMSLES